jgi:cytochrome oxidase assembly protein ShyY1
MSGSRSRRVVVVVVAVLVASTCVNLGFWQLRRLDQRRALNATILDRRSATRVSIAGVPGNTAAAPYQSATARGTYDVDHEVLVYGRSLEGEAGNHVVTPLLLPDGGAILVVRGWVPFTLQTAPVRGAAPPATDVTVNGSLVPDEGDGSDAPDADGIVRDLDVRGIASSLSYDVFRLPLQLADQVPPQPGSLPIPAPLPALSEGPHLSYAIQWFSFAVVALVGAAILLRRDRHAVTGAP